ncbi:MAG: glycosyltransferase [Gemmataceae bacterium]|nr:glycosyltransferase [Gemmataceae bacterium]
MALLSVIIPLKDERDNLRPLHQRITSSLGPYCSRENRSGTTDYEIVFIDDGSIDGTDSLLQEIAGEDERVKVVILRRNFGQTPALQAGIDHASGDLIATMDGDLQNDPADLPMLADKISDGYDAVLGQRANRQDGFWLRKFPSLIANWVIRKVTDCSIKDMGCTIRVLKRNLAQSLPLYGEMHRFIPVLAQMCGGKLLQVPVLHHPRTAGKTKYNLTRTFRVILDLITVKFLYSYLTRPMHFLGSAGLLSIFLGSLSLIGTLGMKWGQGTDMTGNPLLLLSVLLVLVGVQLISMGLLGEIMTRTYFESQGKPSYLVREALNLPEREKAKAA